jgi:hypothetical protein
MRRPPLVAESARLLAHVSFQRARNKAQSVQQTNWQRDKQLARMTFRTNDAWLDR